VRTFSSQPHAIARLSEALFPPHPAADSAAPTRVAVCIPTLQRPLLLGALLDSLGRLRFAGTPPRVRVVVADNDAGAQALQTVEEARVRTGLDLEHVHVPERNISLARNQAVQAALAWGAEWVAFVDDDEVVHPDWLQALLDAQRRWGADAVSGRVDPAYAADAPAWVVRGGFFTRSTPPAGTPMEFPQMCNALVSARMLEDPQPFDPGYGRTGGSDALFFARWHRAGARMVSAPDAVVEEAVHPTRARAGWILRRAFRVGNTAAAVEASLPRRQRRLGQRALGAGLRLGWGVLALLPGVLRGRAGVVRGLWSVCFAAGFFAGVAGYRYEEYRQVHGA